MAFLKTKTATPISRHAILHVYAVKTQALYIKCRYSLPITNPLSLLAKSRNLWLCLVLPFYQFFGSIICVNVDIHLYILLEYNMAVTTTTRGVGIRRPQKPQRVCAATAPRWIPHRGKVLRNALKKVFSCFSSDSSEHKQSHCRRASKIYTSDFWSIDDHWRNDHWLS